MKTKILLDTDIGSDIDDALCLAYLLKQPACELLGITTVSGEADRRAMMASVLCKRAEKEIPIYPGIEKPLLVDSLQKYAGQAERIGDWPCDKAFPKYQAIDFMRRTIRENPGEVVLLAIGPMTNVAALFTIDPEIPALLKELVLMCGEFFDSRQAEWNAKVDPHAAAIVYNAPVEIRSVGLDVTTRVVMSKREAERCFAADILKPVKDFSEVWFKDRDQMVFHDPLAAAVIFNNQICSFERGEVAVELLDRNTAGKTCWKENKSGHCLAAKQVDAEAFFHHYMQTVQA